jgi:hypothetical protein
MEQSFNKSKTIILLMAVLCNSFSGCKGQTESGTDLLRLDKTISLPDVKGRIDHLDINLKEQIIYVAALGNNSLVAVDIHSGKIIYSIKSLDEPQGVGYIPQHEEIFVANGGNGDCYFYNAHTFEKTATIHLASDADDVRYDSLERKIYVGYGAGGIAIINADTHKQIGDVKLPAHPESFQIDKKLNRIFVNLPDAHMVGAVILNQLKLTDKWERSSPTANFPMSVDTIHHLVFVGYRHPARLVVLDGNTGKELSINKMAGDSDDLYYDDQNAKVFVSGGEGYINIFQQQDKGTYKQIANIPTRSGARTSLFVPQLRVFVVAARAAAGETAALLVYKIVQ